MDFSVFPPSIGSELPRGRNSAPTLAPSASNLMTNAQAQNYICHEHRRFLAVHEDITVARHLIRGQGIERADGRNAIPEREFLAAMRRTVQGGHTLRQLENGRNAENLDPSPAVGYNLVDAPGRLKRIIRSLEVGQSIVLKIGGWSVGDLQNLFQNYNVEGRTYGFMIWMAVLEQLRRSGGDGVPRRLYKYHSSYLLGQELENHFMVADGMNDYSVHPFSLDQPLVVTKVDVTTLNLPTTNPSLRASVVRAAGFKDVFLKQLVGASFYFPQTVGDTDCFFHCVTFCLGELAPSYKLMEKMFCGRKGKFKKGGVTSHMVNKFNKYLAKKGIKHRFQIVRVEERENKRFRFSPSFKDIKPAEDYEIHYIARCLFNGTIEKYGAQEVSDKYSKGSNAHYIVLLKEEENEELPDPINFNKVNLSENQLERVMSMEDELRNHIHETGDLSFEELFEANKKKMWEAENKQSERKAFLESNKPPGFYTYLDMQVCVMDIESMFQLQFNEELEKQLQFFKELQPDYSGGGAHGDVVILPSAVLHVPYFINYATVNLPNLALQDEEVKFQTDMPDEEARTAHDKIVSMKSPIEGEDCATLFIDRCFDHMVSVGKTKMFAFAHNGSGYDWILLTRWCDPSTRDWKLKTMLKTSRGMVNLRFVCKRESITYTLFLRCSKLHIGTSLEKFGEAMKVPKQFMKNDWDWKENYLTMERWEKASPEFKEKLRCYATADISCLSMALYKLEVTLQNSEAFWPFEEEPKTVNPRISFCTFQSFIRGMLDSMYFQTSFIGNQLMEYENILSISMFGGSVRAFTRLYESGFYEVCKEVEKGVIEGVTLDALAPVIGKVGKCLKPPDANSLYPSQMKDKGVPKGPGHYVRESDVSTQVLETWLESKAIYGIFFVRIEAPYADFRTPPISYRVEGSLLYTCKTPTTLNADELEGMEGSRFLSCNYKVMNLDDIAIYMYYEIPLKVCFGTVWGWNPLQMCEDPSSISFEYAGFVAKLYEARKKFKAEGNDVLQNMCKLGMNGAFGSSGRRAATDQHVILANGASLPPKFDGLVKKVERFPICNGTQEVTKLIAESKHTFDSLSCKTTVTNRILSASRRHMYKTMLDIAKRMNLSLRQFTDKYLHYMDTDSMYVDEEVYQTMEEMGLINGELGAFSADYEGYLLRMFAPSPKVRFMEFLMKNPKSNKWEMKSEYKCKGLPVRDMSEEQRRMLFSILQEDWQVESGKTVWRRDLLHGVRTMEIPFDLKRESVQGDNEGLVMENLNVENHIPHFITQKFLPHGYEEATYLQQVSNREEFEKHETLLYNFVGGPQIAVEASKMWTRGKEKMSKLFSAKILELISSQKSVANLELLVECLQNSRDAGGDVEMKSS